jgi:hypothetical protein
MVTGSGFYPPLPVFLSFTPARSLRGPAVSSVHRDRSIAPASSCSRRLLQPLRTPESPQLTIFTTYRSVPMRQASSSGPRFNQGIDDDTQPFYRFGEKGTG